jgi:O-antigen/teichoic acid export membrane protein
LKPNRPLNLFANYVGTSWTVLIQLLLVPVYIGLLGVESYGLVGFYMTMLAVLQILDVGLSPALNRELARRTALATTSSAVAGTASLVKTLEAIYWTVGVALALAIAAGSSLIANHWINSQGLPPADVARAIALMGLSFAFQWPISFYMGGLQGLQRQTLTALMNIATITVFGLGVVALLIPYPSVNVFFGWRAITSLLTALVLRRMLWTSPGVRLPGEKPRVQLGSLSGIWAFSLGMTGITVTGMILTQVDKLVLTKLLPLDQFGYYSLATSAASLLPQLVAPLFVAVFPMLSQALVGGNQDEVRGQFHLSAQLTALVVFPAAVTLVLFAQDVLTVWTGDPAMAQTSARALSLLALGALLNSVWAMPYTLQLAHGWTRLSVGINLVLVAITVPYAIVATWYWGTVGAASTAVFMNAANILFAAPITFRRLMPGEGRGWLLRDVALPLVCITAVAASFLLIPAGGSRLFLMLKLVLVAAAAYLTALLTVNVARARARELLAARFGPDQLRGRKSD